MSWRSSLIRIASYRVEQLRRRLAEVMDRRAEAELKLILLDAEAEAEGRRTDIDAEAGWYRVGYLEGWRARREAALAEIAAVMAEEAGAREAVAEAFEELKKYEQVHESAQSAARKEAARLETASLDELGKRRAAAGR